MALLFPSVANGYLSGYRPRADVLESLLLSTFLLVTNFRSNPTILFFFLSMSSYASFRFVYFPQRLKNFLLYIIHISQTRLVINCSKVYGFGLSALTRKIYKRLYERVV